MWRHSKDKDLNLTAVLDGGNFKNYGELKRLKKFNIRELSDFFIGTGVIIYKVEK